MTSAVLSNAEIQAKLTAPGQMLEVVEEEVAGRQMRVYKHAPPHLPAILELSRAHGDKTFLVYENERTTFAEHYAAAVTLAHRLRDRYGVEKGDRVAIAMRNLPEWILAFWAATLAGAVVVPLNAWWTGPELEYGLTDSASKVLVADEERAQRLAPHLSSGQARKLDGVVVARAARPEGIAAGFDDFADVLGEVTADVTPPVVDLAPDDDATIFYTSGTTGKPKGALGTHRNVGNSLMNLFFGLMRGAMRSGRPGTSLLEAPADRAASQEATLLSVPLFHVTGCHAMLVGSTAGGAKLVMMHRWDAERALELIERERITTFGGVPAMVWQVLESPDFARRDISSVKSIGYGGAPAPPELVRRIDQLFPGRLPSNGYGMTETSAGATANTGDDYKRKPDSVGLPLPVCDVRIVGPDGADMPPGATGELWIGGPLVVKGYWNKPEATAETFADGWVRTGDIARVDDEGFIYIVDRAKDMVIRGGENVYCAEVEAALFEHPAVTDCAVIGVPHPVLGEEVGAVVVLRQPGAATAEDIQNHVRQRLASFKVPAHVWLGDEPLPRNPAGKVLKSEVRSSVLGTGNA